MLAQASGGGSGWRSRLRPPWRWAPAPRIRPDPQAVNPVRRSYPGQNPSAPRHLSPLEQAEAPLLLEWQPVAVEETSSGAVKTRIGWRCVANWMARGAIAHMSVSHTAACLPGISMCQRASAAIVVLCVRASS